MLRRRALFLHHGQAGSKDPARRTTGPADPAITGAGRPGAV